MLRLWSRWCRRRQRPRVRRRVAVPGAAPLERRDLPAAAALVAPAVAVTRVTPGDGGVTVSYRVNTPPDAARPASLVVARSADPTFDGTDRPVTATTVLSGAVDLNGVAADALGEHRLTLPYLGTAAPDPSRPYLVASAGSDPGEQTSVRTHVIGVVIHGGIQNPNWASVPVWEGEMVQSLRAEGYDQVIPFNWVKVSDKPGYAAGQGVRLARQILEAASTFPKGEPVDVHLIAHSEGAVVVSQGLAKLEPQRTPELTEGATRVTLLDPHAANTGVPGQQYSVGHGPIAWLAKGLIDNYQSGANDPPIVYPNWVDTLEVFYQQSPASRGDSTNRHIYNLWGQVPLREPAVYFDLTQNGVTHAGKFGVTAWYQTNVVPKLGEGATEVADATLTASVASTDNSLNVDVSGRAQPGSTVRVLVAPANDPGNLSVAGRTVAADDGSWSISTRALPPGLYRGLARSLPPRVATGDRLPMIPTAPLGRFSVGPARA